MTTNILKKIVNPFKKAIKWYFNKLAENGTYIYVTGMFPPEYYNRSFNKRLDK